LGVTIRRATADDAGLLSELARKIFFDTFGPGNTPENMAIHARKSYSREIQLRELNDESLTYLIAESDGEPAGFAMIGRPRSRSCDTFTAPIELFRFYVDERWHGKGVAQPMMRACEEEAVRRGGRTICLNVWEHNPRAIRYYEKIGFRKEGTVPYILGNEVQTDWVMVREIMGA
jgi:ribosomal protein S18 acetylase RimI-like enzyme